MTPETRAHLIAWRDEIAATFDEARAAVEAAYGKLQRAQAAEAAEKARVADIRNAVATLPTDRPLASAIASRLAEVVKPPAGTPNVRAAETELETAQYRLKDLLEAFEQINGFLNPPAPKLEPDPVPVSTKAADFDPIVPARAAA